MNLLRAIRYNLRLRELARGLQKLITFMTQLLKIYPLI